MRTRRTILLLAGLTFILVVVLMVWQLSSIQGLRMQIAAGLHGNLQKVAEEAARQLQQDYVRTMDMSMAKLLQEVEAGEFRESNLNQLRKPFRLAAGSTPLCNAWLLAFPRTDQQRFRVWEYKPPNRYRRGDKYLGNWRDQTELTDFVSKELSKMLGTYGGIDKMSEAIWSQALDSNIVFIYDKAFSSNTLLGAPIFDRNGKFKALVFRQTDGDHFAKVYLRDFFHLRYWAEEDEREGLEKRFLQFGVMKGQGGQLIYHSIAYGTPTFEHQAKLANYGPWLGDLSLGISFRDASVEEVTQSIYRRNVYLILALFGILIVVLMLLVRAAMQLFRLSRLKTEFVANVSHEIKTPLATIRLATDSLRLGRVRDPESMQRTMSIISDETERLDYLIHSLLDFSQLESGRKRYQKKAIPIQQLWHSLRSYAQRQDGIHLELEEEELPERQAEADPKAMEQVLALLIDNARKYGEAYKRLVINCKYANDQLVIQVQDFGPGIAPKDHKIIFEKFVRLGNLDEHNVKGHGIGLSIGRAIMQDHGGNLLLRSTLGKGATFIMEIPCIQIQKR